MREVTFFFKSMQQIVPAPGVLTLGPGFSSIASVLEGHLLNTRARAHSPTNTCTHRNTDTCAMLTQVHMYTHSRVHTLTSYTLVHALTNT